MTKLKLFLSTVFILLIISEIKSQKAELVIEIRDFENNNGKLELYIFDNSKKSNFPKKLDLARYYRSISIKNKSAKATFKDIPYGNYAVTVFHDENSNKRIDRSFFGFPIESFGVSTNAKTWGPPSYDDCNFDIESKKAGIVIYLQKLF